MPELILSIPNSPAGRIALAQLRERGDRLGCYELRSFANFFGADTRELLNNLPRTYHVVSVQQGTELATALRVVRFHDDPSGQGGERGLVEGAEPNTHLALAMPLGLPFALGGYHSHYLKQMNVTHAHGNGIEGAGVRVAVIDTGIDTASSFVSDFFDVVPPGPYHPGSAGRIDRNGHGTAMATLVHEVAPKSDVASIRITDQDDPTVLSVLAGLVLAVVEYRADVVSLSLGFETFGATCGVCGATAEARSIALDGLLRGLLKIDPSKLSGYRPPIYVAAVGNGQRSTSFDYPAAYDCVLAVGAVDSYGTRASFSNFGTSHSTYVMAPGGSATVPPETVGSGTIDCVGTSVSAAYVAGLCALVWSEPSFVAKDRDIVIQEVLSRCRPTGRPALEYGSGIASF